MSRLRGQPAAGSGELQLDKFALWQQRNPGGSFRQYYAETAVTAIRRNKVHPTLGPIIPPEAHENARRLIDFMVEMGLKPDDLVVDYGCGTLRLGRPLMQYLDPDRYVGFDIDERIIAAGRELLDGALIQEKRPALHVINSANLARVAARKPRWIICTGVLHHVPPDDLNEFLAEIGVLAKSGATAIIAFRESEKVKRVSSGSWHYSFSYVQSTAKRCGLLVQSLEKPGWSKHAMLSLSA